MKSQPFPVKEGIADPRENGPGRGDTFGPMTSSEILSLGVEGEEIIVPVSSCPLRRRDPSSSAPLSSGGGFELSAIRTTGSLKPFMKKTLPIS